MKVGLFLAPERLLRLRLAMTTKEKALVLTIAVLVWVVPGAHAAKTVPLYRSAQKSYKTLMASPAKKKYRDNWFQVINKFEKVVKKAPKSPDAPRAFFSIGMLYSDLYNHSLLRDDLEKSLEAYRNVAKKYPRSSLSDDSLYEIGEIYRTKLGDKQSAYQAYAQIISQFPKGDQATRARYWAKSLEGFRPETKPTAKPVTKNNAQKAAVIRKIEHWTNPDSTRVAIEASQETVYSGQLLRAEPEKGKPPRVYVDISHAVLPKGMSDPIPIKDGLLTQVRASQFDENTVRVVLDIDSIDDYTVFNFTDPFRVLIDVRGEPRIPAEILRDEDEKPFQEPVAEKKPVFEEGPEQGEPSPVPARESDLTLYRQLGLGVKKIVIDPGHGGEDAGAIGRSGLREKDIVLKIAKKLRKRVKEELGVDVVMTREGDTFVPLEGRTGIAMKERGDIFVSIHANSARNRRYRGVSTYVLHDSADMEARAVAARENAISTKSLSELQVLYPKIIRPENYRESLRLAREIQGSLIGSLRPRYSKIRNIGVKEGPFFVLVNAPGPSILVEVSFISNPDEEKKLGSEDYQESVAEGILKGIKKYVEEMKVAAT